MSDDARLQAIRHRIDAVHVRPDDWYLSRQDLRWLLDQLHAAEARAASEWEKLKDNRDAWTLLATQTQERLAAAQTDLNTANAAIREFIEWTYAYMEERPMANGDYAHLTICSASRQRQADGTKGCVCAPRSVKALRASAASAEALSRRLHDALRGLLDRYTALVNSGDCGFWNPETDNEVITARAVLNETPQP